MNFHEFSWTFMIVVRSMKIMNFHELSWTFMNFHELEIMKLCSFESIALPWHTGAMRLSFVKPWNLSCSSFYNEWLKKFGHGLFLRGRVQGLKVSLHENLTAKTEKRISRWMRCMKTKLQPNRTLEIMKPWLYDRSTIRCSARTCWSRALLEAVPAFTALRIAKTWHVAAHKKNGGEVAKKSETVDWC